MEILVDIRWSLEEANSPPGFVYLVTYDDICMLVVSKMRLYECTEFCELFRDAEFRIPSYTCDPSRQDVISLKFVGQELADRKRFMKFLPQHGIHYRLCWSSSVALKANLCECEGCAPCPTCCFTPCFLLLSVFPRVQEVSEVRITVT